MLGGVLGRAEDQFEAEEAGAGLAARRWSAGSSRHRRRNVRLRLGDAPRHGHGFGRGGRLVEQRGVGEFQAGQVDDHLLVVEQRFQPALGDLGLVGRVGGVPAGVLQDVAQDHLRRQRVVDSPCRSATWRSRSCRRCAFRFASASCSRAAPPAAAARQANRRRHGLRRSVASRLAAPMAASMAAISVRSRADVAADELVVLFERRAEGSSAMRIQWHAIDHVVSCGVSLRFGLVGGGVEQLRRDRPHWPASA